MVSTPVKVVGRGGITHTLYKTGKPNRCIGQIVINPSVGKKITYTGKFNRGAMTLLPTGTGKVEVEGTQDVFFGQFLDGKMIGYFMVEPTSREDGVTARLLKSN